MEIDTKRLPMMPIRDVVVFPHMMMPFVVGRESSIRALDAAMAGDKRIFLAAQRDASVDDPTPGEVFGVGTIVNIVQSLKLPDGNIKVLVEGVERARVVSVSGEDGSFRATVETPSFRAEPGTALDALVSRVTGRFARYAKLCQPQNYEQMLQAVREDDPRAGRYRGRRPAADPGRKAGAARDSRPIRTGWLAWPGFFPGKSVN